MNILTDTPHPCNTFFEEMPIYFIAYHIANIASINAAFALAAAAKLNSDKVSISIFEVIMTK